MFQPAMLVYWSVVVLFPISSNYLYLLGSSFLAGIFSSFEDKITPSSFPIFQNLYSRPYEEISPFDPEKKCRKKWSLEDLGTKIMWFHGTSALFSGIFKHMHYLGWFNITSPCLPLRSTCPPVFSIGMKFKKNGKSDAFWTRTWQVILLMVQKSGAFTTWDCAKTL